ncbi:hypothetical protein Tco_1165570 [Tanacetum coccineum]
MSNLECKSAIKRQRHEQSIANAIRSWSVPSGSLQLMRETLAELSPQLFDIDEDGIDLSESNIKQCKRKICDGHYTAAVRVLSSSSVAPYNDDTLEDLKAKHPFKPAPSLPYISINHHHLIASPTVVLDRIKSFSHAVANSDELVSSITQVVNLFLDGNCPKIMGEYIACAPLIPLVKPRGGIRPITVGTVWRRLVSKFGVGVSGGGEAILYTVNCLIEGHRDDVGLSMLLVDFKNAFNLVDREVMLKEVRIRCPAISRWAEFCYSSPDCTTGNTPYGHAKECSRVTSLALYFFL